MPWVGDKFYYSTGLLKSLAANYTKIYEGCRVSWRRDEYNLWALAEYKADFDIALRSIGKGHWTGDIANKNFKDFIQFGKLQRLIIADILGVDDYELGLSGFYRIPQLRGYAFFLMKPYLNRDYNKCLEK